MCQCMAQASAGLGLFQLVRALLHQMTNNLNIILGINHESLSNALPSEDDMSR